MNNNKLATEILMLNKKRDELDKNDIVENVEYYLGVTYPECKKSAGLRLEKIIEITGSNKQTVYSWFNKSRGNVKIPFFKLCMIAEKLDVDIEELLVKNNK